MKWSLYAAVYAYCCGVVLLAPLGFVADALVQILGQSTTFTVVLVPGSGAIVGAIAWWGIVERRGAYTYPSGGLAGLATALGTVLLWVVALATVWAPRFVVLGGAVIAFVLAVVGPVGFVAGLPLLYARRRMDAGRSATPQHAG